MRSIVGVGMTPPKVLGTPKPASSVMISSTLGALFGGTTRGGHHGLDCRAPFLITPPNFGSGGGSCWPLMVVVALGEPSLPVTCWAETGVAARNATESAMPATAARERASGPAFSSPADGSILATLSLVRDIRDFLQMKTVSCNQTDPDRRCSAREPDTHDDARADSSRRVETRSGLDQRPVEQRSFVLLGSPGMAASASLCSNTATLRQSSAVRVLCPSGTGRIKTYSC